MHCDGNPWTVAEPASPDGTVNEEPFSGSQATTRDLAEYAQNVRECTKKLCAKIIAANAGDDDQGKEDKAFLAAKVADNASAGNLTGNTNGSDDD